VNFYKILNEEETHHGLKYHTGLNVDPRPFNPRGSCEPGGIYFTREDILAFLDYGPWLRKVTIPKGEPVYENPGSPKKWKAKRVILGPRRRIDFQVIKELVREGANIHADDDFPLQWAAKNGYLNIVEFLMSKGANIYARNDKALRLAAAAGHLGVLKHLINKGVNIHTVDNCVLLWAAGNGHLNIVKFLAEKGMDIHVDDDEALEWAAAAGHLNVVKYLVNQGANVYSENDEALVLATRHGHTDVVEYLKRCIN